MSYVRDLPGISLRIERCDATSVEDVRSLLQRIAQPIGGCLHLAALLSDRTFFSQTTDSFALPFTPKIEAFSVFKNAFDISKLDFFIAFSTISTFGNSGQTNYAA